MPYLELEKQIKPLSYTSGLNFYFINVSPEELGEDGKSVPFRPDVNVPLNFESEEQLLTWLDKKISNIGATTLGLVNDIYIFIHKDRYGVYGEASILLDHVKEEVFAVFASLRQQVKEARRSFVANPEIEETEDVSTDEQ